ncbi:hypothetical protein GDO78_001352 [Eleutherodactylus coqui]|uniref:Zinc finger-containing ubiquitin peptidase 1 n=1 Tax=Eleutherodactylus coqui TaxID=57060 RepID=A0A8J6FSY8_ELECQ|nr:hypothetical protein GDO78_001352 [Eleutherodactylus coqui]
MLVCDICTQEVPSEDDMKSHLLVVHVEQDGCCPLCTVAGLTYDELSNHVHTAHADTWEPQAADGVREGPNSSSSVVRKEHVEGNHRTAEGWKLPVGRKENKEQFGRKADGIPRNGDFIRALPAPKDFGFGSATVMEDNPPPQASAEDLVPCPFCGEATTSIDKLELHVELEHPDLLASPNKGMCRTSQLISALEHERIVYHSISMDGHCCGIRGNAKQQYECPMCSLVCANDNLLEEHVNLHLEENYHTAKVTSDSVLARQLQAEEDQQRRVEESEREKEEFQKLQRQFGLDNSGGYRQQSVRNLERAVARGRMDPMEYHLHKAEMLESLATGVDDGRTRTSGVLEALYQYYNTAGPEVRRVWLCSPLNHFSSSAGDTGWGCGFRNFQMLFSSILLSDAYKDFLQDYRYIPCIPKIQELIEDAWKEGFDPHGASHFNGKLQGTRAWIGACEIFCLLTSLRLKCQVLDFHTPSGPSGTHPLLFEWVQNYYASDTRGAEGKIVRTSKPAIYLQHQD